MNPWLRRLRTGWSIGRLLPMYAAYAVLKRVVPLNHLAKRAWQQPGVARDRAAERHVIAAVGRLRQWIGRDADCLQSSLVLYRELSRLGAEPVLAIGFRRQRHGLEGHAWVSVDGHPLLEGMPEDPFIAALHFGHGGRLMSDPETGTDPSSRTA